LIGDVFCGLIGISVASGIPDFRSPGGMYDSLKPELITATEKQREMMRRDPTYVVEKSMFMNNQFPYLEVRRPFILGTQIHQWKATLAHYFAKLLHTKMGKLTRVYTQNIDGLQYQCEGLPAEKIVSVHGSIGLVSCEACGASHDFDTFCEQVRSSIKDIYNIDDQAPSKSSNIFCDKCQEPTLKPATVLFGGNLPEDFYDYTVKDLPTIDLLIIAGTSLVVSPANSIVYNIPDSAIRLIVNNEAVGEFLGIEYGPHTTRDVFVRGTCEEIFLDLMLLLGWKNDLLELNEKIPHLSYDLIQKKLSSKI